MALRAALLEAMNNSLNLNTPIFMLGSNICHIITYDYRSYEQS